MAELPTIKLSKITSTWPPCDFKTASGTICNRHIESLAGLHDTAWLTGVQLKCPDVPNIEFYIKLNSELVSLPFGTSMGWFQTAGEWHALPWAIPASFATALRLYLEIYPIGWERDAPLRVTRHIGFHEVGAGARYLFVDMDGCICALWNAELNVWGKKDGGHVPQWGEDYYVVPSLRDYLFHRPGWVDGTMHKFMSWDEFPYAGI
jgi:hypothetical protein